MAAIEKFVFEEEMVTLPQLVEILKNNWEGNQVLQMKMINEGAKFGNGQKEAGNLACEMVNYFVERPGWREPPVRTNGATPFCLLSLLCHCWIQSIYFSHREVFRRVNTFNIDLIGIIRYTIHDSIGKSTFTITDLLVPFTFTELRTKDR